MSVIIPEKGEEGGARGREEEWDWNEGQFTVFSGGPHTVARKDKRAY